MSIVDLLTGRSTARLINRGSPEAGPVRVAGQPLGRDTHVIVQRDEVAVVVVDGKVVGQLPPGQHVLGNSPFESQLGEMAGKLADIMFVPHRAVASQRLAASSGSGRRLAMQTRFGATVRDPAKLAVQMGDEAPDHVMTMIQARLQASLEALLVALSRSETDRTDVARDRAALESKIKHHLAEQAAEYGLELDSMDSFVLTMEVGDPPSDSLGPRSAVSPPDHSQRLELKALNITTRSDEISREEAMRQLRELAALHAVGALTAEEFEQKRAALGKRL